MSARYYVEAEDGTRYGPADLAALRAWVAEGRLRPESTLVAEADEARTRADAVPDLFPANPGTDASLPPVIPSAAPTPVPTPMPYAGVPAPKKSNTGVIVAAIVLGGLALCAVPIAAILFPVFTSARAAAKRTMGLSGMKQLATGVLIYQGDFDDQFPPHMESAAAVAPAIRKLLPDPTVLRTRNPSGGEILGDARLSDRNATELLAPQDTILFYDSLPWSDGRSPVARADGSAKILPSSEITRLLTRDPFGKTP